MVKTKEIKAAMTRAGITQKELAEKLRINPSTLNRKINNEDGKTLTLKEAQEIADVLMIPENERLYIFFAPCAAKTQQKAIV